MSHRRTAVAIAAAAAVAALSGSAAAGAAAPLRVEVLSDRADAVSGGDALLAVDLPPGADPAQLRVRAGKRDVTRAFAVRPGGRVEGLVEGLHVGATVIVARLPKGPGGRLALSNHPQGGPVFSGPQLQPWTCQPTAVDAQCDEPARFTWLYKPTTSNDLVAYDPANPPGDVATTTTDSGAQVPFVVREEIGYQDRSRYRIETLATPGQVWDRYAPPASMNHKLVVMHGGSCRTSYAPADPPFQDYAGTIPANPAVADSSTVALGRGFTVMSTALDNSGVNCNPALQAESILMAKEHVIETYGDLRFTIGSGCSGGSLAQLWMANAYPGLYQGLITQCTFPDAGSTVAQIFDQIVLANYLGVPTAGPAAPATTVAGEVVPQRSGWTTTQAAAVAGDGIANLPLSGNWAISAYAYGGLAAPELTCPGVDADRVYDAQRRPDGVRCGIADWVVNLLGPRSRELWGPQEQALGHGFGGLPADNVGVQYGLAAVKAGQISPAQFVDLNRSIGGLDVDFRAQAARTTADPTVLANAYRSGYINEANNLDQVAIINLAGPNDPGVAHDTYRAFALQARLQREHGTAANLVMWQGPVPLAGDLQYTAQALVAMDRWLSTVDADRSGRPLPTKLIADKPADVHEQCSDGAGTKLTDALCGSAIVPVYGTPRTVAGQPLTTDQNKCELTAPDRGSYGVTFTDEEWRTLQATFPDGVCDFSRPGVGQQPTLAWQTYGDARGGHVYGGTPLGAPPAALACRTLSAFTIRTPGRAWTSARVLVNGRLALTVHGKVPVRLQLRRFPGGRVSLVVRGRTRGGRTATLRRTFVACDPHGRQIAGGRR